MPEFHPNLAEVLAKGDEIVHEVAPSRANALTDWYQDETQRRRIAYEEFYAEPIVIDDVELKAGMWVNVLFRPDWNSSTSKPLGWPNCRYLGKEISRDWNDSRPRLRLLFERWGGKPPSRLLLPRPIKPRSAVTADRIVSVEAIEPVKWLAAAVAEYDRRRAPV